MYYVFKELIMPYGIIYKATGPTGKVYIGQTIQSFAERKKGHKIRAVKKDRRYSFGIAILEHGFESFVWEQIDTAETKEELGQKEKYWIAHYQSDDPEHGYNMTSGGISFVPNAEWRKRNSESHKGLPSHNKGKHLSDETKRKLSEALKGKPKNHSKGWAKGEGHTEEHRRKISEALRGEKNPMFGKHPSEETRRKLSEAQKLRQKHERQKRLTAQTEAGDAVNPEGESGQPVYNHPCPAIC
ncbi:GIY-YIG nuclease family protein [Treponema primitia]|uniref:NUMOD3 domain-containing DNA-binding protein n=1 Tax=Treponema primitia TaxID=88058 RepID=UPI00397FC35E